MHFLLLETIHVSDGTKIWRILQLFTSVEWFFCFLVTMFLLCNFLIRSTMVFFYYNIYVEWHVWGGREEGYVPVADGAKGSIQQSSNLFKRNSHPMQLWVSQWSFFSFGHTWTVFFFFFALYFNLNLFLCFWVWKCMLMSMTQRKLKLSRDIIERQ